MKNDPIDLGIKNLRNIHKNAVKIMKNLPQSDIPLVTLDKLINYLDGKYKSIEQESRVKLLKWQQQYNEMLNELFKTCERKAKDMNMNSVSLVFLNTMIEHAVKQMR